MLIYKYIDTFGLHVIRDRCLKVSRVEDLNDPFEIAPRIDPHRVMPKDVRNWLLRPATIDMAFEEEAERLGIRTRREFKRWYREPHNLRKRIEGIKNRAACTCEDLRRDFASYFSTRCRLLCLSETPQSILMWSHYANMHTGLIIAFDTEKPRFNEFGEWMFPVQYPPSHLKPEFDFVMGSSVAAFIESMKCVVATKAMEWSYEKEVRIIVPLGAVFADLVKDAGRRLEFIRVNEGSIAHVIFGCRCPVQLRTDVMEVLTDSAYKHVRISEARMSRDKYCLEFRDV